MKHRKNFFVAVAAMAASCLFVFSSCQIAEAVIAGTTYYDTEIMTKDNRMITGRIGGQRSSNLPSGSKTISIKTDEGREKIKSETIEYMKLARKGHPEKQQTLVYTDYKVPYKKKGVQKFRTFKCWQVLDNAGDNLIITAYGHSYSLAKDGALIVTYSSDEGIQYCIRRHGDDSLILIGRSISGRSFMRKQWQAYLADDAVLCRKIAEKEIDAFDFKSITEQYIPGRK